MAKCSFMVQMPFGKHKGKPLDQVPSSYLFWVLDCCDAASPSLLQAIRVHLGLDENNEPKPRDGSQLNWREIINSAFRRQAMKYHPDRGGDLKIMSALNATRDLLVEYFENENGFDDKTSRSPH